jgi:hypothetical protein
MKSPAAFPSTDGKAPPEMFEAMEKYNEGRTVTDSPLAETKELVAGYWVWQVRSMEEAPITPSWRAPADRSPGARCRSGRGNPP